MLSGLTMATLYQIMKGKRKKYYKVAELPYFDQVGLNIE
jgi:hypothetical protein